MKLRHCLIALLCLLFVASTLVSSGCASTQSENGVTIEKKGGNPLKFW